MKLKNKTAIVTGAAGKGMGRSIALTLAREGANVVVNYNRSREEAENIVQYINSNNGRALSVKADIFSKAGCDELINAALEEFQGIDILVLGPGSNWNTESIDKLDPVKSFANVHNEVSPIFHFFPGVLPIMYKKGWGRIIGIASLIDPPPPSYSYNVAKKARTNALLLAKGDAWKHGVTVNIISPGPVGHIDQLKSAIQLSEHKSEWTERADITPQDIAESVLFLCSDEGRFITGTEIYYGWK